MKYTFITSRESEDTYSHAGATFGEIHHCGVELVFEQIGMGNHRCCQHQTGGCNQGSSHHLGPGAAMGTKL